MLAIFRFELKKLWQSNKLVAPSVILLVWIFISDSIAPLFILSTFSICAMVQFFIMTIVGLQYGDVDGMMADQSIYVKITKKHKFFMARVCVIVVVNMGMTVVSVALPLFLNLINDFGLFDRPVVFSDIWSGLLLFILSGTCGGVCGLFMNSRIFKRREIAILFAALFAIASCVKTAVVSEFVLLKYVLWILPPVSELGSSYSAESYFSMNNCALPMIWLAVYLAVLVMAYDVVMCKRAFE